MLKSLDASFTSSAFRSGKNQHRSALIWRLDPILRNMWPWPRMDSGLMARKTPSTR